MKKLVIVYGILLIYASLTNAVTIISMTKKQIQQEVINKTFISIPTDNLNGKTIENTFSMFMDTTGKVLGEMSRKPDNEPQFDTGKYSILDDGTIYFTWRHWDSAKKLCFNIFKTKNTYISISCDNVFHTAFMKSNIQPGNHLK